jgi:hypothetical protein
VAGEATAALAALQPILAADPRGETALEAVAATVIDDGASLMELP